MDMISYLPQSILHDILSRLPDKDVARTSVLSKVWHDTWYTFPFLVFDESRYGMINVPNDAENELQMKEFLLNKLKFCILVLDRMIRFRGNNLTLREFKLVFKSFTPPYPLSLIYDLMEFLGNSGIEVLQLENPRSSNSYDEFACLPLGILEAKSLIKLELSWDFRVDQAFLNHPIKFSSLQVLSLSHVYLGDGQVVQNLISSCPSIEKLKLVRCFGLKSVSIHGLTKLKVVYIVGIEEVDVDAPSLENLFYDASDFKTVIPCKINMDKCTNIRELCLVYVSSIIITDQWLLQLFKKFPLLEKLVLGDFYMSDMIYISSIQLKFLKLYNCYGEVEDIVIDAPNLYKCIYHSDGSEIPYISIVNSSSQLVLDVAFFVDEVLLDVEMLRGFLEDIKPKHIPISLFLGFSGGSTTDFDQFELEDYSFDPPSIKHVTLCADSDSEEWNLLLVTSFFWICRPSIVSFNLDNNKTLVKIFCEKLIHRKKDDCCCSSIEIECWWHFLKDVKVSTSFRNHIAADDFKILLEPFPTLSLEEEKEISRFKEGHINFWLEWLL